MLHPNARIYVAGHGGLVGSALVRRLRAGGYDRLILRTRAELDLTDRAAVDALFADERPDVVILAAAKVGGILANATQPVEFLRDNLLIELNVIEAAARAGVGTLLFLGSSCIYPKFAPQPIREESLLAGALEPTNEAYAIAKIAGLTLCRAHRRQYGRNFFSVMPSNLYGPGDNFDPSSSHVLPALIRRFHEAAAEGRDEVVVWGSGTPRREFLFVDDLADACVFLLESGHEPPDLLNVGSGEDLTIAELAHLVADVVDFRGRVAFDPTKPDGTPRKLLDVSRLRALGWSPATSLRDGVARTYDWYLQTRVAQPA
jgi:GDP-L-fucose synthase